MSRAAARGAPARTVRISIDGRPVDVREGVSLAAALQERGVVEFRTSARGEPRAPLCGMGTCFECRVAVDGVPHLRSCLVPVREGMEVGTGGAG